MIEIQRQPSRRQLRVFAALWLPAFCALVGWLVYRRLGNLPAAAVVWVGGALISAVAVAVPRFARLVYLGLVYATYPIGWVVSHLVLVVLFYLLITPFGLVRRLFGRDPLLKRFDRQARSHWRARQQVDDVERYFRQY